MRRPAAEELREGLKAQGMYGPNVDKICDEVGTIIDRMWENFEELVAKLEKDRQDFKDWGV